MNAVMAGLRAGGMDRINTIQFTLNETSLDSSYWKPKVDFSFVYSYAASYAHGAARVHARPGRDGTSRR